MKEEAGAQMHACPVTGSPAASSPAGSSPPGDSVCRQAGLTRCAARLLDVVGAGISICRDSGELLYLNPAGATILGIDPGEVEGCDIAEVFAPLERLRTVVATRTASDAPEISIQTRDGREVVIGYRLAETTDLVGSESRQTIILFQDITDYERLRKERDHLLKVATVSRLLPTIAHEIKNPLAGIQCLAESMQHDIQDQEQREDLQVILNEVERMRLVVDGLGLAGGCLLQGAEETDLAAEVGNLLRMLRPRADQLGIGLTALAAAADGAGSVRINRGMLRLVLLNLVNNALEACSSGDSISVRLWRGPDRLELIVADTGCGMSAELARRATELFYTTKPGGSGIGLALIAQVVQRDGGELQIISGPGEGTTVRVRVPQEAAT